MPLMFLIAILIWLQDWQSPFYVSDRVGLNGKIFKMIKLRSMVVNADKSGVDSTSADDARITSLGRFIRQSKLDEIAQLFNVLCGDMSLVGPRPNVLRETELYTSKEQKLLLVRPGITDFASIVFSDESDILKGKDDPDLAYNQLIRPGKSKLGLFYISNQTFLVDISILFLTVLSLLNRKLALDRTAKLLMKMGAPSGLCKLARRDTPLFPSAPPGANNIVRSRN